MKPFARRMGRVRPSAIRELLRWGADPGVISFGGGYPDAALFPVSELAEVMADLLRPENAGSLQYTASVGLPELRSHVAHRLGRDGVRCTADDVLIIHGGQQGLDLVARLMIDPGDVIITEDPTILGALIAFNPCEPRYVTVRSDDEGMDTDDLERVLAATPTAKMIYLVPDFANPTGATLSLPRRRRLIELADTYDLLVVEDTPYRPLRYSGRTCRRSRASTRRAGSCTWAASRRSSLRAFGWAGRWPSRSSWAGWGCSSWPLTLRAAR